MSSTAIPHTHERAVPVEELPAELARLWFDVTEHVEADHGELPLHTNILTLIAIARGRREERLVRETLLHLAEAQPSRAVAVYVDAAHGEITATVSANCRLEHDTRVTCYEVIELRVPEDRLNALPSILAPLELFDVPTFLWWVGEVDPDSAEYQRIVTVAERVVVDTSRFDNGIAALRAYHQFLCREDRTCTASDLTWARAASWRELIAQSFDNPAARELLWGLQNIEIDFDPAAESQALLLAGWLGARLGWKPVSAERRGATLLAGAKSAGGATVTVVLNRQATAGVGLRSVRMLARGASGSARTTIRRRNDRLATVSFETPGMRQERVVPDVQHGIPELISSEMLVHTRDRVFEQALECATGWLNLIEESA